MIYGQGSSGGTGATGDPLGENRLGDRANHPDTDPALPAWRVRRHPIAVRRTADRRIVGPRAAAENFFATRRSCQVDAAVSRGVNIVRGRVVKAIFPDIAVHIVQAKSVGGECPRRRRRAPEYAGGTLVVSARFIGHPVICRGGDALPVAFAAYGPALTAIIRQIGGDRRASIERAGRSRTAGVFPLCFAGQAIVTPG